MLEDGLLLCGRTTSATKNSVRLMKLIIDWNSSPWSAGYGNTSTACIMKNERKPNATIRRAD